VFVAAGVIVVKAKEVDDLGEEKNKNADSSGVIGGEKEIGNEGNQKSELEEVVFGKLSDSVNQTEQNTAQTNNHEDGTTRLDEAEDEVGKIDPSPNGGPRGRKIVMKRGRSSLFKHIIYIITWAWVREKLLSVADT